MCKVKKKEETESYQENNIVLLFLSYICFSVHRYQKMFPQVDYLLNSDTRNIFLEIRYHKLYHKYTLLQLNTHVVLFIYSKYEVFAAVVLILISPSQSIDKMPVFWKGDLTSINSQNLFSGSFFFLFSRTFSSISDCFLYVQISVEQKQEIVHESCVYIKKGFKKHN